MRPHRQRQPTYGTIIDNARDSSVASRVSFSDHRSEHSAVPMPSPSIHDEDAQDQGSDYFTYSYAPSYETFRQRIRLGALSSLALLLTILLLFAYFVEATMLSVPVILGLAAYLSSDAIRTHFIFTLLESDTAILVFHALLQECLRLPATLFALNAAPGPDILVLSQVAAVAFGVAWGMAFAESALRAWNLWQQTSLYVDVLLSEEPSKSTPSPRSLEEQEDVSTFLRSDHPSSSSPLPQDEESAFIDNIFDAKSRERARLDLEDLLGMPLFVVPSFLLPLWSLNSYVPFSYERCLLH